MSGHDGVGAGLVMAHTQDLKQQLSQGFSQLKEEVKKEAVTISESSARGQPPHSLARDTADKEDGLGDVDMMDIEELEKQRGDNRTDAQKEEDEALAQARLQRQALTFE